jgi:hypothetical protein
LWTISGRNHDSNSTVDFQAVVLEEIRAFKQSSSEKPLVPPTRTHEKIQYSEISTQHCTFILVFNMHCHCP